MVSFITHYYSLLTYYSKVTDFLSREIQPVLSQGRGLPPAVTDVVMG